MIAGLPLSSSLNKLEKYNNGNLIKFNKNKCEVLYLEQNNPMNLYSSGNKLENSFPKKDL